MSLNARPVSSIKTPSHNRSPIYPIIDIQGLGTGAHCLASPKMEDNAGCRDKAACSSWLSDAR